MQKKSDNTVSQKQPILPIRENHAFSWRFIATLTLMGCIAVEVLMTLLPTDFDTPILYWFFPVSLLLASQMYFNQRITRYIEIKLLLAFFAWGCVTVVLNYGRAQLTDSFLWFASTSTVIFLGFTLPYAAAQTLDLRGERARPLLATIRAEAGRERNAPPVSGEGWALERRNDYVGRLLKESLATLEK